MDKLFISQVPELHKKKHRDLFLDCGDPTPINGLANFTAGTTLGETAKIACSEGYNLTGSDLLSCTDNGWDHTPICTIQGILQL